MARPKLEKPKDQNLIVRIRPQELALIDQAAELMGLDRSKFVRACLISQSLNIIEKVKKKK